MIQHVFLVLANLMAGISVDYLSSY